MIDTDIRKSISKKLIVTILTISSCATLIITSIQLAYDYHQDVKVVEQNLDLIQTSQLKSISEAIWNFDHNQVRTQLDGLLNMPGVVQVVIFDRGKLIYKSGQVQASMTTLTKTYSLVYQHGNQFEKLGTMEVQSNLSAIYTKLFKKVFIIFISQFLKTLLVSVLFYLAVQYLLAKNLKIITSYLSRFDFVNPPSPLDLKRKKNNQIDNDEFDILVRAINRMRHNLIGAYTDLENLNTNLEKKVEENTQTILLQRQALEHSSKMSALGEMAGGIAHEINTPLAVIGLRTEQLLECVNDGEIEIEILEKNLNTIFKTTRHIAKIISGLRFFAREGRHLAPAMTKIKTVIDDTLGFCKEKFGYHGVRIDVILSKEIIDLEIECRGVEISQVLLNLLNNSFDAQKNVKDKWVCIEAKNYTDLLELRISDNGPGIPEELREKIMQPFFTTKEVGDGTGIGLSISKGIVSSHNGEFYLDTDAPTTTFVIKLPKKQSSNTKESQSA